MMATCASRCGGGLVSGFALLFVMGVIIIGVFGGAVICLLGLERLISRTPKRKPDVDGISDSRRFMNDTIHEFHITDYHANCYGIKNRLWNVFIASVGFSTCMLSTGAAMYVLPKLMFG